MFNCTVGMNEAMQTTFPNKFTKLKANLLKQSYLDLKVNFYGSFVQEARFIFI